MSLRGVTFSRCAFYMVHSGWIDGLEAGGSEKLRRTRGILQVCKVMKVWTQVAEVASFQSSKIPSSMIKMMPPPSSIRRKCILWIFNHVWFLSHVRMFHWFIFSCLSFTIPRIYIPPCSPDDASSRQHPLHDLDQRWANYALHAASGQLSLFVKFCQNPAQPYLLICLNEYLNKYSFTYFLLAVFNYNGRDEKLQKRPYVTHNA